jgi:trk system potassium uptake protein
MINFRVIARVLGLLVTMLGVLSSLPIFVSLYYDEGCVAPLLWSTLIMLASGFILWKFIGIRIANSTLRKQEGFLIVTLGWVLMSAFGTLPYLMSGAIPDFTDAFFETMSGFTTTGASILTDIEALDHGLLFWRSMTQWIGGMGIIVMTIAILPILGIGGMELFLAEAPGPTSDKLHPRIKETAKRLWLIYAALTALLTLLLGFGEMGWFDAVNHGMTTMATGGFSTRQDSIAYFQTPYTQYIIVFFMFLAGTNYTLIYFTLTGKVKKMWQNEEFRTYFLVTALLALIIFVAIYLVTNCGPEGAERAFRDSLFQVVSIITTTGFVSADYTAWAPAITVVFFLMLFLGASAGSTSGGVKIIRHLTMAKNCILEFRRVLHPRAIIPVKLNGRIVLPTIVTNVLVFILIYMLIFAVSSVIMAAMGLDFETAIGAVATALSNVGPGIGKVGPVDNFSAIPEVGKWFLSFLMLVGRLELFTVLVLFTRYFWRMN